MVLISHKLELYTHRFVRWTGSSSGFVVALLSVLAWVAVGGCCGFSQAWRGGLSIYIGILTYLMVFMIQRSQNKELTILHVKLNELISATKLADKKLINVEELTEKEISVVQDIHRKIGSADESL